MYVLLRQGKEMSDAVHFHETGAKWFRVMWGIVGFAALLLAGMAIFSVYRPPKPTIYEGSDWPALIAILVIAGFFAASFGLFGLWRQWRKPLRFSVSSQGVGLGNREQLIPWSAIDRLAFHWRGQRFEIPTKMRSWRTARSGMSLLIYAREGVAQPAGNGLEDRFRRSWYGTPHIAELGILDATIDDVLLAIQKHAPADVLARSGMLEV